MPNRERYAYRIGEVPKGSSEITIVTVGKNDENWERVLTLPNLEELTLHEPTSEQMEAVAGLRTVRRLRVTHARPKTIDFVASMGAVEELVLEYVSGFDSLAPLRQLAQLRALHLENLRRVRDFEGLSGLSRLQYLSIEGTLDWKQPVDSFEFLRGLPALEVLRLFQVATKASYPAMLPALALKKLKKLRLHRSYLRAEEYALLEEALPAVEGASWGPWETHAYEHLPLPGTDVRAPLPDDVIRKHHPDVTIRHDGSRTVADPAAVYYMFTGLGAGRVRCQSSTAQAKCGEYAQRYEAMRLKAREIIAGATART